MVPVLVIYTRSQSCIHPGWSYTLCVGQTYTRCWSCKHPVLAIYTRYWSYIYPLLVISTQCSVGHIHSLAQKRLQPHAQLRRDFLYWSPCLHALSLKSFYPIQINYLVRISLLLIYDGFCVKATSSSVYFILQWSLFSQCGFDQKER